MGDGTVAHRNKPVRKLGVELAKMVIYEDADGVVTAEIGNLGRNYLSALHAVQTWQIEVHVFVGFQIAAALFGTALSIYGTAALRHYARAAREIAMGSFHIV